MHYGKLVFSQLMAHLPLSTFRRCVATHRGEHKVKDFSCLDQFLAMAHANATRPWQIYADFVQHLIGLARPLYAKEPLGIALDATVYAFDATTISLCLSVFP